MKFRRSNTAVWPGNRISVALIFDILRESHGIIYQLPDSRINIIRSKCDGRRIDRPPGFQPIQWRENTNAFRFQSEPPPGRVDGRRQDEWFTVFSTFVANSAPEVSQVSAKFCLSSFDLLRSNSPRPYARARESTKLECRAHSPRLLVN